MNQSARRFLAVLLDLLVDQSACFVYFNRDSFWDDFGPCSPPLNVFYSFREIISFLTVLNDEQERQSFFLK